MVVFKTDIMQKLADTWWKWCSYYWIHITTWRDGRIEIWNGDFEKFIFVLRLDKSGLSCSTHNMTYQLISFIFLWCKREYVLSLLSLILCFHPSEQTNIDDIVTGSTYNILFHFPYMYHFQTQSYSVDYDFEEGC